MISRTEKLKTRVDNKTQLCLALRDVYDREKGVPYWGSKIIVIPPRGCKTIPSGTFLKEHRRFKRNSTQQIDVTSGANVLLTLTSDDFQNNQGKDLILDTQDNRFGYAFLQPPQTTRFVLIQSPLYIFS